MNRLAIFDCDGTLVDSQRDICLAMAECFAAAGLEPPADERTRRVVGLSLIEAIRAMASKAEHLHLALAEGCRRTFQRVRGRGQVEEPLYEGIAELVAVLAAEGWLLGVATGKSDHSPDELRGAGAHHIAAHPLDIIELARAEA